MQIKPKDALNTNVSGRSAAGIDILTSPRKVLYLLRWGMNAGLASLHK